MARTRKDRAEWIRERMAELALTQPELLHRTGLARQTFKRIERGEGTHPRSIRNVEAVLSWAEGSMADIDAGRAPTVIDVDAILARALPAHLTPADLPAQLRAIRQQMGAAGFWREIGLMEGEEGTERDRPHATG